MGNVVFGRDVLLGFAKESSYNEAWGSPALTGIYISPDFDLTYNIDTMREVHAHGLPALKTDEVVQGIKNYSFRISGKVPKEGMGWLLLSLFGKVTTTVAGAFYHHTFSPSQNTPPSLKLALQTPFRGGMEREWHLRGAIMKSLEISGEINNYVTFTAEFTGGSWERISSLSTISIPVPSSGNPFYHFNESAGASIAVGTVSADWNSATLRFESVLAEDIEDSYEFGSDERKRLERAATEDCFKASATLKRLFLDTTLIGYYEGFDTLSLNFTLGITTDYCFKIANGKSKVTNHKLTPKGLGLMHEEITVEGFMENDPADILLESYDTQSEPATQGT